MRSYRKRRGVYKQKIKTLQMLETSAKREIYLPQQNQGRYLAAKLID